MNDDISMNNFFRKNKVENKHEIVSSKKYDDYYDVSKTITTAGAIDPHDFDSSVYNRERIFEDKGRLAERLLVSNDGNDTLFIVASHGGTISISQEVPLYPGEIKVYYNIYELRLRSPTAGNSYRVMEYELYIDSINFPILLISGLKSDIAVASSQITTTSTLINKVVTIKVRSLGTGSYIAFGNSTSQNFRLLSVGSSIDIDWIDDLSKIYVSTDVGNTGAIEWIGG